MAVFKAMVGLVAPDQIEIRITVDREEMAGMTYGQRERWLGKLAEAKLAEQIPPRPPKRGLEGRIGGSPTRGNHLPPHSRSGRVFTTDGLRQKRIGHTLGTLSVAGLGRGAGASTTP
jgi:hypothetical protein